MKVVAVRKGYRPGMYSMTVPKFSELGVASDRIMTSPVDEEQEDVEDFAREIA